MNQIAKQTTVPSLMFVLALANLGNAAWEHFHQAPKPNVFARSSELTRKYMVLQPPATRPVEAVANTKMHHADVSALTR